MIVYVLIILWLAIFGFLILNLAHSPKGSRWLRLILHSRRTMWKVTVVLAAVIVIVVIYALHPPKEVSSTDVEPIFADYSRTLALGLAEQGTFTIDSACDLTAPKPELAYILPAVISIYNEVVAKPTVPRLMRLDDTLVFSFDGYKQFKNRSINITKGTEKKLGPRYTVNMESRGINHEIRVTYNGNDWDNEQLCSLPAMEAASLAKVDPALLMSIIRHTSDFQFDYVQDYHGKGLLGLDSGKDLEQIFIGARMLRQALDSLKKTEDAVAAFYPVREQRSMSSEWRKNPQRNSWVESVLGDIQFYKNNGLK